MKKKFISIAYDFDQGNMFALDNEGNIWVLEYKDISNKEEEIIKYSREWTLFEDNPFGEEHE